MPSNPNDSSQERHRVLGRTDNIWQLEQKKIKQEERKRKEKKEKRTVAVRPFNR